MLIRSILLFVRLCLSLRAPRPQRQRLCAFLCSSSSAAAAAATLSDQSVRRDFSLALDRGKAREGRGCFALSAASQWPERRDDRGRGAGRWRHQTKTRRTEPIAADPLCSPASRTRPIEGSWKDGYLTAAAHELAGAHSLTHDCLCSQTDPLAASSAALPLTHSLTPLAVRR